DDHRARRPAGRSGFGAALRVGRALLRRLRGRGGPGAFTAGGGLSRVRALGQPRGVPDRRGGRRGGRCPRCLQRRRRRSLRAALRRPVGSAPAADGLGGHDPPSARGGEGVARTARRLLVRGWALRGARSPPQGRGPVAARCRRTRRPPCGRVAPGARHRLRERRRPGALPRSRLLPALRVRGARCRDRRGARRTRLPVLRQGAL
ncbi:MAG: hypothetical protein AVDCRST_MAG69-2237, partial [uncultured Solirubrobacteraceae bacterium]